MNNTNNLHPYAGQSYSQTLLVNISRIVFGFLAVSGNGYVLYTIGRNRKIQQNLCNLLIGVLAFADFWTGIGLFFGSSVTLGFQLIQWYDYTIGHCLIIQYTVISGIQMSQVATIFIALDRLKAVRDPMRYSVQDRVQRSLLALTVTVVYSSIASGFIFVGVNFNEYPTICQAGSVLHPIYIIYWQLFAVCVAAVIVVCYVTTSRILTKKLANSRSESLKSVLAKQKAVFKTISIVLTVYTLCWCLPNFITIIATLLTANPAILGKISPLVAIGTGINSSANVLIYAWKHEELGTAMRAVLSRKTTVTTVQIIQQRKVNSKMTVTTF